MLKVILFFAVAFSFGSAHAADVFKIECSGFMQGIAVEVTGDWVPGKELKNVKTDVDGSAAGFVAGDLKQYTPKNPFYFEMNRFELEDTGGSKTSVLLPQVVKEKASRVVAYYYDQGEFAVGTIPMACDLK